jgi:hypothetical protein
MLSASVLLAYSEKCPNVELVEKRLRALGCEIESRCLCARTRRRRIPLHAHECVVVLWSRAAGSALGALARHAKALGKLTLISVDGATAPAGMGAALRRPRGPRQAQWWREVLKPDTGGGVAMNTLASPARASSRWHAMLAAIALLSVAVSAAYVSDATFAARVDGWAQQLDATASAAINGAGE